MLLFLVVSIFSAEATALSMAELESETALKVYGEHVETFNQPTGPDILANNGLNEWMKNVPGWKRINQLSIPGTHETCSRYGGSAVQCQDWDIWTQLQNGVRMLDIRCRHISDCFMIHHDLVYQHLTFGTGVRDICITFLKNHPSETIFMMVKQEYNAAGNTRTFEETMQRYIEGLEKYFYLREDFPPLDTVRGKIVILNRFGGQRHKNGIILKFQDNAVFTSDSIVKARVQDCYYVGNLFVRGDKWNKFYSMLREAANGYNNNILFINYASGCSVWCYPFSTCEYMNPAAGKYMKTYPNAHTGIVLFDYINAHYNDLISSIIQRNMQK